MTQQLPVVLNAGFAQRLQSGDYLDGADTLSGLAGGRLTLTTGTPVTVSDVTAVSTLYYTPYIHDRIALYTGSRWTVYQFSEMTGSLTGSAGAVEDIFVYWNSGTPIFSGSTWTNSTTRATALSRQNGVLVLSTDATQRYVGTVAFSATNQTSDAAQTRYVWNNNNRVRRGLSMSNSTVHTYGTSTWREWNGGTGEIVKFVTGTNEDAVVASIQCFNLIPPLASEMFAYAGLGIDSTSAAPTVLAGWADVGSTTSQTRFPLGAKMSIPPSTISTVGTHFLAALEYGGTFSTSTATFDSYVLSASMPM